MLRANRWVPVVCWLGIATCSPVLAAPPWAALIPFKRVAADASESYELGENNGPWMIMCSSFAGPTAEQQARDLVLELRQSFQIEAYTFRQTFDFSKPTEGLGFNKYGEIKRMKYLNGQKFVEIAVLAGNFSSIEDPALSKTLDKIKHAHPVVLETKYEDNSSQRFLGLRTIYRSVTTNPTRKQKGPMGAAFVTRNPLLPEEYFAAKGLDPFLVEINKDITHSLLKNPGRYTVRVASFRGVDSLNKPAEFEKAIAARKGNAKIDEAALKASRLCAALRAQGVEAYEFHDRTESIVTIGSFNDVGQPRPDGKTEINPAIHRIMEQYGPVKSDIPGTGMSGLQLRTLAGIPFDPQPLPVEVPRESVATAYNQTKSLYR